MTRYFECCGKFYHSTVSINNCAVNQQHFHLYVDCIEDTQKNIAQFPFGNFPFQCHKNQYLELRHNKAHEYAQSQNKFILDKPFHCQLLHHFLKFSTDYFGRECISVVKVLEKWYAHL